MELVRIEEDVTSISCRIEMESFRLHHTIYGMRLPSAVA